MKVTTDTVHDVIKHHFGKAPKEVRELSGGFANFVYEADVDGDTYIIRIADEQVRLQFFIKEQWAVAKVREMKVPVPEILEVANEASTFPYMIVKRIDGRPANQAVLEERLAVIHEMGKYTALINSTATSGFGHIFDWSSNQLSRKETWKDYLEKELEMEKRLAIFERHKILNEEGMAKLRAGLKEIETWSGKPTLNHGDMRLKNILLNEKGKICAILDWESCVSSIAPQWDLSVALHDLSIDEKDAFIDGYGLSPKEYRNRAYGIKVLNIINYAPFVEMAQEAKEEKRKVLIEDMKTRLRGDFDLYSL